MSEPSHQLAAIMFTDIVGYSTLIGKDEENALQILRKNRQIQRPIINKYQGKWLKEMGDGVLASFNSVVDAVMCALDIQETCASESQLTLRIGIHLGEVVFEDEDVFGEGVNIASRLEPLAPEGGVLVSEVVHRNLLNKPGIVSKFFGEKHLKNVGSQKLYEVFRSGRKVEKTDYQSKTSSATRPRRLILAMLVFTVLIMLGALVYFTIGKQDPVIRDKSIAILPFYNMSSDPEQEYFSDGVTEEIINILAQIPDLKVVSRTSSFQFRQKEADIKSIAKSLGVSTILEGSVRKHENRIRITAQLINAEDGFHIWSNTYERELTDVFAIQDELSKAIVDALQLEIGLWDTTPKPTTSSLSAHNYYLKGRYFWNQRTPEGLQKAIQFFEQALGEDSGYALAYSGIADAFNQLSAWGYFDPSTTAPKAKAAAKRAIEIDPKLGQPYAALAFTQMIFDWDFERSKDNYLTAIQLNPNYASARMWLGNFYEFMGETELANIENIKATELDPLSTVININLARFYTCAGDYEKALLQAKKTLELGDDFPVYYTLYQTYFAMGKMDTAFENFVRWRLAFGEDSKILRQGYSDGGWAGVAEIMIPLLEEKSQATYVRPLTFAEYYIHAKNYTKALDYLEEAVEKKEAMSVTLGVIPIWRSLYAEPRFRDLLKRIGLPEVGQ